MNALKVRNLLGQKYSTHFYDLVHNISRPVFGKPCCYSNTVMRAPLREKIQNAINRAINPDCLPYNDYNNNTGLDGALIVGGRRRSRKKKNKKNGQKKKKSPSLESIKAKLSPPGCRKGGKGQDIIPLIDGGEEEFTEGSDVTYGTLGSPDSSDQDDDDFGKKGKHSEDTEMADAEAKEPEPVAEEAPKPEGEAEEKADAAPAEGEAAKEGEEGKGAPSTDATAAGVKSEKSPLINKDAKEVGDEASKDAESKLKDAAPGFLCCTIM